VYFVGSVGTIFHFTFQHFIFVSFCFVFFTYRIAVVGTNNRCALAARTSLLLLALAAACVDALLGGASQADDTAHEPEMCITVGKPITVGKTDHGGANQLQQEKQITVGK
jgi:hypothetical protein